MTLQLEIMHAQIKQSKHAQIIHQTTKMLSLLFIGSYEIHFYYSYEICEYYLKCHLMELWNYNCVLSKVDKKVVLEHFDWQENKVDTLRKVAFELQDLCKTEVSSNHRSYTPITPLTLCSKPSPASTTMHHHCHGGAHENQKQE